MQWDRQGFELRTRFSVLSIAKYAEFDLGEHMGKLQFLTVKYVTPAILPFVQLDDMHLQVTLHLD